MLRLIAVTLTAFFGVLWAYGEPQDVTARAASETGANSFVTLASFVTPQAAEASVRRSNIGGLSESEAIDAAIAAGEAHRTANTQMPILRGLVQTVAATPSPAETSSDVAMWFVTGSSVNLRSGPGTSNGVIGQVGLGDSAKTLSDTDAEWIQIRTAGGTEGWIFGKFLSPDQPG